MAVVDVRINNTAMTTTTKSMRVDICCMMLLFVIDVIGCRMIAVIIHLLSARATIYIYIYIYVRIFNLILVCFFFARGRHGRTRNGRDVVRLT